MLKELITPTDGWRLTYESEADICLFLESCTLKIAEVPTDYQKLVCCMQRDLTRGK